MGRELRVTSIDYFFWSEFRYFVRNIQRHQHNTGLHHVLDQRDRRVHLYGRRSTIFFSRAVPVERHVLYLNVGYE